MDRCPNCRARRRSERSECHRCGMSLVLPLEIERQAEQMQRTAMRELLGGDLLKAKQCIDQARRLKDGSTLSLLEQFIEAKRVL